MCFARGASSKLAQQYVDGHVAGALQSLQEVEKGVVTAEAGGVPIVEPMERGLGLGSLVAVGALIAVGIIISDLI